MTFVLFYQRLNTPLGRKILQEKNINLTENSVTKDHKKGRGKTYLKMCVMSFTYI